MQDRRTVLTMAAAAAALAGQSRAAVDAAQRPGALGPIRAVTITAADVDVAEQAWTRFMGYRVVSRGRVPAATAQRWGAPAVTSKRFVLLGPASGEETFLRFVEQPTPPGYEPDHTHGWSTTEITVQNSDQLYERLKDSTFKVTGPPRQVPTYSYLKAMQATGPSGERLNLTCITEPRPDLAVARSFVGRCFIAVMGGPDLPAILDFHRTVFGAVPSAIRDLPTIKLAVVPLGDGSKIEADQHPPTAHARRVPPGGLPPGLALVTFECRNFAELGSRFIAPPGPAELAPHMGRRVGCLRGAAGELMEVVDL